MLKLIPKIVANKAHPQKAQAMMIVVENVEMLPVIARVPK